MKTLSDIKKEFSEWFAICKVLTFHRVEFIGQDSNEPWTPENRPIVPLLKANTVSSRVYDGPHCPLPERHKLIIDIDHEAVLMPSSTEGHYHLIIDKQIPWEKYEKLLLALVDCGIVEEGYVSASIERRGTYLRLPWVKKNSTMNALFEEEIP